MSFTLCTSGAIIFKAGANASSAATTSGAMLADFCDEAEGQFCFRTRFDWVANWADVGANFKPAIADAVSDLAAMKVMNYDMSGYTSRQEAGTMLDILNNNSTQIVTDAKDFKTQDTANG